MRGSLFGRMLATWGDPRGVVRDELASDPTEGRLLAYAMGAALIAFATGLPEVLSTNMAASGGLDDPASIMAGWLVTTLFAMTLLRYLLAGLTRLTAGRLRGTGDGRGARLALFWASLASSPALIIAGGFHALATVAPGTVFTAIAGTVDIAAQLVLLWFWVTGLEVTEGFDGPLRATFAVLVPLALIALIMIAFIGLAG